MTSYIGLIRKKASSDFGVDFPDFPGCVSAGTTLDEARRMAQETIEIHVSGMVKDGEELPSSRSQVERTSSAALSAF
jgi:predicted RNase H-like HicB family nuclease